MILLLKRVELTMHIKIALLDSIVSCMHYLCLSVCMSVFLYICLSVCLSACKLVCLHVCVCLSFDLSACLRACQHACVSIFLRACLSAWASRNLGLAPCALLYPNFNKKFVDKLELTVNRRAHFEGLFRLRLESAGCKI